MQNANLLLSSYVSVEHVSLDTGSTTKEGYLADIGLAAVHVNIQPASMELLALYGGAYGKAFTVFTTASGILETDRLTTVSGTGTPKVYIVKGKMNFDYGQGQHIELYVEETA